MYGDMFSSLFTPFLTFHSQELSTNYIQERALNTNTVAQFKIVTHSKCDILTTNDRPSIKVISSYAVANLTISKIAHFAFIIHTCLASELCGANQEEQVNGQCELFLSIPIIRFP